MPLFSNPFIITVDVLLFSITETLWRLHHISSCFCSRRMLSLFPLPRLGQRCVYIAQLLPWQQTGSLWKSAELATESLEGDMQKKKKKQCGRGTSVKIQMVFLSRDISTFITEYRALTCRILNYNSVTFIPHSITNRYTKRMRNNFRMCCLELNNNHPPHNAKPAIGLKNLTFLLRNGVISVTKVSVLQIINHKAFFFCGNLNSTNNPQ